MKQLLPLGLAAIIFNPLLALEMKSIRNYEAVEGNTLRVTEPASPLTLKAALELAYGANAALSTARRELEAVSGSILQAGLRPNPRVEALIEDTRPANRLTAVYVNQPLELGGKRPARTAAAVRRLDVASAELTAVRASIRATVMVACFDVLLPQERYFLTPGLVEFS